MLANAVDDANQSPAQRDRGAATKGNHPSGALDRLHWLCSRCSGSPIGHQP